MVLCSLFHLVGAYMLKLQLFIKNISAQTISHGLVDSSWGIVFLVAVGYGILDMLHTASKYSLHLCSCLTNILICVLVALSFLFPYSFCVTDAVSVPIVEMGLLFFYPSLQCNLSLLVHSLLASTALCLEPLPPFCMASPVLYMSLVPEVYILPCSCLYVLYGCAE